MPINPNIILGIQQPKFQMADPLESASKALQIQGLMGQQDMQGMQMQRARQGMERNARLQALLGSAPPDLEGELQRSGFLDESLKVGKERRENKKLDADTGRTVAQTVETTLGNYKGMLPSLASPQDAVGWLTAQYNDPVLKPIMERMGPLEQAIARVPQDSQGFRDWQFKSSAGIDKFMADQRAREQQAETGRHNLTTEGLTAAQQAEIARNNRVNNTISQGQLGVAQGNLGVARSRLDMDRNAPKGTYDAERGIIVDPRGATATPVTMGGQPLGAKDKDLTDAQSKAYLFGDRMAKADAIIGQLAKKGTTTSVPGSQTGYGVGATINALSSANQQSLDQAKRDFINAVLRRESGAVISPSEFDNAEKQYFPQIGDKPEVLKQKAANRKTAQEGIMMEVPARKRPAQPTAEQALTAAEQQELAELKARLRQGGG